MVFPTEALQALRHHLGTQMEAGTLTEEEVYRQALAADPDDFASIMHLLDAAMTARRFAEAERLGWELLRTAPTSPHSYLMFTTVLEKRKRRSALALHFLLLGLEMLAYDDAELEAFAFDELLADDMLGLIEGLSQSEALQVVLGGMRQMAADSGPVPDEALPYRHILALRAESRPMDRNAVDAILADGARTAPLLRGILKQFGEGALDGHPILVERAIGLLGEIGEAATIRDLSGFYADDQLVNPAMWAFWRIASRRPHEVLAEIGRMIPEAEPLERFVAVQYLVQMPAVDGRVEALAAVLEGIEDIPQEQRSGILSTALTGIFVLDGPESATGTALEQRYASLLTKKVRKQVDHMRELRRKTGPDEAAGFESTIYDICCTGPRLVD